jgi:FdhD protein
VAEEGEAIERVTVTRADGTHDDDVVAVEEPLEIRVGDKPLSVTMRTPGDDFDLAAGFLLTEGIVHAFDDIEMMRHWGSPNIVRVALRESVHVDWQRLQRHFYSTSSCGVCGKASIDAIRVQAPAIASDVRVSAAVIRALPDALRTQQRAFEATGAIHATGAFRADGTLVVAREDIGRHNAVDKTIGVLLRTNTTAEILAVSGRAGFEVVQKAIVAGIAVVAAVGAPSSLAVQLARDMNLTLCGFVRDGRFNVYAGEERIV